MSNIAQELRREAAACRVSFKWFGVRRALERSQKAEAAAVFDAEAAAVGASKKLLNTKNPTFRTVTGLKTEIIGYWRGVTLPFPEDGVRLLRRSAINTFDNRLRELRRKLDDAVEELVAQYDQLKAEARSSLGRLYNEADYPPTLRGLFEVSWDYPAIEPPNYLAEISPRLFEAEQARVAAQFDATIRLAEEAFATELLESLQHLNERLTDGADGKKTFRDTAITNIQEFIERFRSISVRSNADLDAFVSRTNTLLGGIEPKALRDSSALRSDVRTEVAQIAQALESSITTAPRRRIKLGEVPAAGAAAS